MLTEIGFIDVQVGPPVDTFGGAGGEDKARAYQVYGHAFLAIKPRPIAEVGATLLTEVLDAPGDLVPECIGNGVELLVCAAGVGPRGIGADDLVAGATIVTAANLVEELVGGAQTVAF